MDYLYILSQFKMFPCFFIIYALIINYVHAFSLLLNFAKGTIFFIRNPILGILRAISVIVTFI